jgi:hypothetical protein
MDKIARYEDYKKLQTIMLNWLEQLSNREFSRAQKLYMEMALKACDHHFDHQQPPPKKKKN